MTLSTHIFVNGPVDPEALFREGQRLLADKDGQRRPASAQEFKRTETGGFENRIGQGLPAILEVGYNDGKPLVREEWNDRPACIAEVYLDTSYGYRDGGWSCSLLHAWLVASIGAWLSERGIPWQWENEFTGDIHTGTDGLREFVGKGLEAEAWFHGVVVPAIDAHAKGEVQW